MLIPVFLILISLLLSPVAVVAQGINGSGISDPCSRKPEFDTCKANLEIHFYNASTGRCEVSYGCPKVTPFQSGRECSAVCEQKAAIAQDEYTVLEALLKEYDSSPWWHIGEKTGARQLDDKTIAFLNAPDRGMSLDASIIRDFNDKNRQSHGLSREFITGKNTVVFRSSDGIRIITISRVGFNADKTQALVFLRDDFRHAPEVFMMEGFFMLLERSGDSWKIVKRVKSVLKHS